jgi:predicted dehydrogenase
MSMNTKPELTAALREMRVAVVGYGSIGRRHSENLRRLGIGSMVLVRRDAASNAAFTIPADAIVVHDARQAVERGIDLAIVDNPTRQHVQAATPFLAAGIPVLIEKPIAADVAEARRLQILAAKHGILCGTAYCMRYHPAYRLAREAITQGRLGRVLYAKAWFESWLPDWHPWEDYRQSYAARRDLGGGVLPTLDHELDFLCWCLGRPRNAVGTSHRSGALEMGVDDVASLAIEYAGGATAHCLLSLCRRDRQRGFEFIGSQASLRYSLETGQLLLCREAASEVLWNGREYDTNQMYLEMLADFVEAVATGRPAPVPLDAGIAALEICQQVRSTTHDA